jgi:dTDP-4-dehydrorhamnose reductase
VRVAVTGAGGRLGRALVRALEDSPYAGPSGPIAWRRNDFDLDDPRWMGERLDRERIGTVIHAAAWTDVDGCAREPELAMRRNGEATDVLARACAERGVQFVFVSTNEVFDGRRIDRVGYGPYDQPNPANAYGRSKRAGEEAVVRAYANGGQAYVVRTAWLYGPPGNDFPAKILAAADRAAAAGERLKVVSDEFGSPTFTEDLAEAIIDLVTAYDAYGTYHHLTNAGSTSRAGWARELFRQIGRDVEIEEVPSSTWSRPSTPPAWGVLASTPLPAAGSSPMRPWQDALADYVPSLLRGIAAG